MERVTWTDERLDDRFTSIDQRFDRLDAEILELRRETHAGFAELHSKIDRLTVTLVFSQTGVIGAIVATGVLT